MLKGAQFSEKIQSARYRRLALALLSTTGALTASISPALAQVAPAPQPQSTEADAALPASGDAEPVATADKQTQDIVVTGSRIVRDGYQSPTPLSVIGSEQLASNANANIAQYVTTLPAFAGSANGRSSTTTGANGTSGINALNLRALGPTRTLVLLDGHRVAPAVAFGYADVSSLPQALISRVDVVTGGVSAVYGSDAVAGVVNFVLNRSLEGITGEVSNGITNYGDNFSYKANIAAGTGFADDRGHILVALEQTHDDGIKGGQRKWTHRGRQIFGNTAYGTGPGQSTSVPRQLVYDNVGYLTAAPGGVVSSGPLMGTGFGPGGQVYQLVRGDLSDVNFMRGGDWATNDLRPTNSIAPEEKRQTAFARASYEVADALNFYGQFSYVKASGQADSSPSYMIGNSGPLIRIDNAYLPDSVRARMTALGLSAIQLGTLNYDLGINPQVTRRKAISYQIGADGKFEMLGGNWTWDVYAQHGESKNYVSFVTNISRRNYTLATDAVRTASGAIVCRSTLTNPNNGCSPYNALGTGVNDGNAAGIAFIRSPSISNLKVEQSVVSGSLTGEPFSTWAGPVSVAFSAEYRKDKAVGTVDADSLIANHIYGNYAPIDGSTNVKEAAFETVIPLAKGKPWADSWEFNGAARYTSYSLAGNVATWKVGTTYSPIPDITFRATRSRDIRAPNLNETFLPQSTARQALLDPFRNSSFTFEQVTTGNRNLKPEKADTLGIGAVFKPRFLDGFTASVDYWSINVKGAISIIAAPDVLQLCFNGTAPELCNNITRAAPLPGQTVGDLIRVVSQNINIASQKVRGLDIEASYRKDLDGIGIPGSIDIHANFTRYLENSVDNGITARRTLLGENSLFNPPTWRSTATLGYQLEGFRGALTARAFSAGKQFAYYIECTSNCPASTVEHPTINDNHMPGRLYLDLALSYDFLLGGRKSVTTFFNVRNLTNKDPGLTIATGNAFANGGNAVLYDVDGVVFRVGVRFKL
ncbi:TonB-dependent receptor [Sphingobium sp. H39-3-25]|uniref:TonB-dependent receptor plug domain-containing protein n=1 Tax=Sphingobium arseniciresistens TaxID=3030834 RepID=UPI0023B88669|nr:TonB-dependent receptor [Sphingobium arseniciresistens]